MLRRSRLFARRFPARREGGQRIAGHSDLRRADARAAASRRLGDCVVRPRSRLRPCRHARALARRRRGISAWGWRPTGDRKTLRTDTRTGSSTVAHAGPLKKSRLPSVTTQIFIGLLLGIAVGELWPSFGVAVKPLADAFLRTIKMIIAPLLFWTLVVGIAGTGDLKSMGRIGFKAILYFEVATTIALFIGLALVNVFRPGAGLAMPIGADTSAAAAMLQN